MILDKRTSVFSGAETSVLIVEDDLAIGEMLETGLQYYGFLPRFVASVPEAKALLARWKPDYILSDYHLGQHNGEEVLKTVALNYPDLVAAKRFQFVTGEPDYVESVERKFPIVVHGKPFRLKEIVRSLLACPALDEPQVLATKSELALFMENALLSTSC